MTHRTRARGSVARGEIRDAAVVVITGVAPLFILLVDRDAEFADATSRRLRDEGHHVRIATDGTWATALAATAPAR